MRKEGKQTARLYRCVLCHGALETLGTFCKIAKGQEDVLRLSATKSMNFNENAVVEGQKI